MFSSAVQPFDRVHAAFHANFELPVMIALRDMKWVMLVAYQLEITCLRFPTLFLLP